MGTVNKSKWVMASVGCLVMSMILVSCSQRRAADMTEVASATEDTLRTVMDTTPFAEEPDTVAPVVEINFDSPEAVREFLRNNPDGAAFADGIIPIIAQASAKYAEKLIANRHSGFLVVDKASMRVLLYDRYGHQQRAYGMACAKNYGTKHKKADSRTPEGFFSVEGIYDSTDWLFTDDDGKTSKKKGQFGPRFIRLRIPTTSQIGIHGTCSPWSIGHRTSHGCIRLTNENILELVELVEPGMPVIVLPGKRDRQVNRDEGYDIPYFPTDIKYAMSESEKELKPKTEEELEAERMEREAAEREDSLQRVREAVPEITEPDETPEPGSPQPPAEEPENASSQYF